MTRFLCPVFLLACNASKIDLGDLQSAADIAEACSEYEPQEVTLEVLFEEQSATCPWGEDDNEEPENHLFTARIEQTETLDVPEDAIICDMAFDFSGLVPDEIQVMVYDDHFFFTFNDIILAASFGPGVDEMPADGELVTWDWSSIVGYDYHEGGDDFEAYCLGEESGSAQCDIPDTETEGAISLSFDEDLVAELSLSAIADERYDFAFITTGDDDPDDDCHHESFGFTVDVPYLQP